LSTSHLDLIVSSDGDIPLFFRGVLVSQGLSNFPVSLVIFAFLSCPLSVFLFVIEIVKRCCSS
jgi:hypothetical protein